MISKRRGIVVVLLGITLVIPGLAPSAVAQSETVAVPPWEVPGNGWSGTITTEIHRVYKWDTQRSVQDELATYTQLLPWSEDANGQYSAYVQGSGRQLDYADTCGSDRLHQSLDWTADTDSRAGPNFPGVMYIETDDSGQTTIVPLLVYVDAAGKSYDCQGKVSDFSTSGLSVLGFESGYSGIPTAPVPDEDPDPLHLVGTKTWTLADPPYPLYDSTTEYFFTLTYDLRLEPVEPTVCDDGLDNDGDGQVDFPQDPGCVSLTDASELGTVQCDNGMDDDRDGDIDYREPLGGDLDCSSLTDDNERGACVPAASKNVTYRTQTVVPASPNVHWYTTNVNASVCETTNGTHFITDLDVDRHVENDGIPRAIGLLGWKSGTETDVSYTPEQSGGVYDPEVRNAQATFAYTACYDLTKLLDKFGLKDRLKEKMKRPLTRAIKSVLKRAKITRINKTVRKQVLDKWSRQVDHAFKKGTIKTYLNQKFKIPERIGTLVEKVAQKPKSKVKNFLKSHVRNALGSGTYDGLTANAAAGLMTRIGFKKLSELAAFCGGSSAESSFLRLWVADVIARGGTSVSIEHSDQYLHPAMQVSLD